MKLLLITTLVLYCSYSATGFGSKTYESNNGFPTTFLNDITSSSIVKKKILSRWKWETWDVVPGTHAYQLYVFNITNPDDVEKGGKPVLQQLGPYYYKEYRYKFDVSMNLDMSVNYVRNFTYTFDPKLSKGSEDDLVNTVNIPLIVFSTLASKYNKNPDTNAAVIALHASGESLIKRNVKVGDLLFHGIDTSKYQKYLHLLGPETLLTEEFKNGWQSVLKLKNGANEGSFTVDSGLKVESNVGKILYFDNSPTLNWWEGDTCNKIEGTDGSVFPPNTDSSKSLHMFEKDLCRSISLDFSHDIQYKSVSGREYTISKSTLEDPSKGTACFCRKTDGPCLKQGVLDVSKCQFDAPYVMSYAHFLNADPSYLDAVSGLKPDPKHHQTFVQTEPVTGAVIQFQKRYQWNIWIKPLQGIDYFKKFPDFIFPLFWNDDVFMMDPDKEELLIEELASQAGGTGSGSRSQTGSTSSSTIALFIIISVYIFGRN